VELPTNIIRVIVWRKMSWAGEMICHGVRSAPEVLEGEIVLETEA
jgi:hypothetical protein